MVSVPFCSARIAADLFHGEHHVATRHCRADLEHAEVELVGDGNGDAVFAGDDRQPFGELAVRPERGGEFLADVVGGLGRRGARLAFLAFGFLGDLDRFLSLGFC